MIEILQPVDGLQAGWCGDLEPNEEARLICSGFARATSRAVPKLSGLQVGYFNLGRHALPDGDLLPMESVGSRVSLSASGLAKSGPGRLMYVDCTVAAGNITVYDSTTAAGTVLMPATARVELGFR